MSAASEKVRRAEEAAAKAALDGLGSVVVEFEKYCRWLEKSYEGKLGDQAAHVGKRIGQTRFVLRLLSDALAASREIDRLANSAADAAEARTGDPIAGLKAYQEATKPHMGHKVELSALIELHSETFYTIAARAMKAASHLPGMKSFTSSGIRDVRNHLIEHPEGNSSRVFNGGFAWGMPQGPVLACMRTTEQPEVWQDAGLFVNADEFSRRFVKVLKAARQTAPIL